MTQSLRAYAIASGCLSALGWGITGSFVKLLPDFTTLEVLALRLAIACGVTGPVFLANDSLRAEFLSLMRSPPGLSLSSLMVLYYLFAVRAFQLAPVSDVVLIVGLSPLMGLGLKLVLRAPLRRSEGIGAITAFVGLVLFVLPKLQVEFGRSTYLTGLFFALLSACVTLGYASLFKHYAGKRRALNPIAIAFMTFALGSIVIVPMASLPSPVWIEKLAQPDVWWIALGLGTVSTVVPTLCYSFAAKHLSPILTTTLNLLTPIFAAIVAVVLLGEQIPVLSLQGAALILAGVLVLSLPQSEASEAA